MTEGADAKLIKAMERAIRTEINKQGASVDFDGLYNTAPIAQAALAVVRQAEELEPTRRLVAAELAKED